MKPRARNLDLALCNVRDEVVVYDFRNNQARCLNGTAAAVFKPCDGTRTPEAARRRRLDPTLGATIDEEVVWLALAKLDEGQLFELPSSARADDVDLDRRRLLKKMALIAGLSIAPPAVRVDQALTPAYAASKVACFVARRLHGDQQSHRLLQQRRHGRHLQRTGHLRRQFLSTCSGQTCQ